MNLHTQITVFVKSSFQTNVSFQPFVCLSRQIWMCGGSLLWVPCSRVGHIYRILGKVPYGGPNGTSTMGLADRVSKNLHDKFLHFSYLYNVDDRDAEMFFFTFTDCDVKKPLIAMSHVRFTKRSRFSETFSHLKLL